MVTLFPRSYSHVSVPVDQSVKMRQRSVALTKSVCASFAAFMEGETCLCDEFVSIIVS